MKIFSKTGLHSIFTYKELVYLFCIYTVPSVFVYFIYLLWAKFYGTIYLWLVGLEFNLIDLLFPFIFVHIFLGVILPFMRRN